MKVIGKTGLRGEAICVVNHTELEKFMNLYYGKMDPLEVGDEIDLGKGYDFAADSATALQKTQAFIAANDKTIKAILDGVSLYSDVSSNSD